MQKSKSESLYSFSYFSKPIKNTIPDRTTTLSEVYRLIINNNFEIHTSKLRSIDKVTDAKKYKRKYFDYVTFSGIFTKRQNQSLKEHSGLLVLDFDNIEDINHLRSILLNDNYLNTELLFTSPSGKGMKWIVAIDLKTASYEEYFIGIRNYIQYTYGIEIDKSGKDIARACFLCYDPNAYINPKHLL